MGCACGKKNQSGKFVYISPEGKRTTFNTEVQAKAEKIRRGGGTVQAK